MDKANSNSFHDNNVKREPINSSKQVEKPLSSQEKVLITGDDILIEYVQRILIVLKEIDDEVATETYRESLELFITHYVWHCKDPKDTNKNAFTWQRLEGRLNEMLERRRRLIKYMFKKEGKLDSFEDQFHLSIQKKDQIISKFSSL